MNGAGAGGRLVTKREKIKTPSGKVVIGPDGKPLERAKKGKSQLGSREQKRADLRYAFRIAGKKYG